MFRVLRPNVTLLRRITLYPRYIQSLSERRFELKKDIDNLDEHVALTNFKQWLSSRFLAPSTALNATSLPVRPLLRSVLSTFLLHYNSRVASLCGHGYYTIGPCGEESLASAALALDNDKDTAALHYRHLGISFLRNWSTKSGGKVRGAKDERSCWSKATAVHRLSLLEQRTLISSLPSLYHLSLFKKEPIAILLPCTAHYCN